ncbi:MAG: hypothetical protein ABI905_08845 [Betaproteobacteria bacterium]
MYDFQIPDRREGAPLFTFESEFGCVRSIFDVAGFIKTIRREHGAASNHEWPSTGRLIVYRYIKPHGFELVHLSAGFIARKHVFGIRVGNCVRRHKDQYG